MVPRYKEIIIYTTLKTNMIKFSVLFFSFLPALIGYPAIAESTNTEPESKNKEILIQDGNLVITRSDARFVLEDMSTEQKQKVLAEEGRLKNILLDLMVSRKTAQAARDKGLNKNKLIAWKINKLIDQQLVKELTLNYSSNLFIPKDIELLAKEYYDSHPKEYEVKETVKAAHILFLTKDKSDEENKSQLKKANKLLEELKSGLNFSEAAKKYSEDKGSAQNGGSLGYFTRGKMVKPFEDAVFKLKNNNELSDIVKSQFGYHIIKLLDHKSASIISYESVKDKLIAKQEKKYRQKRTGEYSGSFGITKSTNIYAPALQDIFKAESIKLQQQLQQNK